MPKPSVKTGTGKKGAWKKYGVQIDGVWYSTFDTELQAAMDANVGEIVRISYTDDGGKFGRTITDVQPGGEPELGGKGDAYEPEDDLPFTA